MVTMLSWRSALSDRPACRPTRRSASGRRSCSSPAPDPGYRPRRRVGRRVADGARARAARTARLLRQHRADRLSAGPDRLLGRLHACEPITSATKLSGLGLAICRSSPASCCSPWAGSSGRAFPKRRFSGDQEARRHFGKPGLGDDFEERPRTFLIAVGIKISEVSWVYILTVFVVVYATTKLGIPKAVLLDLS